MRSTMRATCYMTDDTLGHLTKIVAEQYAWEMYLCLLDLLQGALDGQHVAREAAKVIVAKVAACECKE